MACEGALMTLSGFEDIAALEVRELIGITATVAAPGRVTFKAASALDLCRLCFLSQSAHSVLLDGLKISPFGLSAREYNVFGRDDVGGSLAYALVRLSGYEPGRHSLFDPFTSSGAFAIEAAFFASGFPVSHYGKEALASAFSGATELSKADSRFFGSVEEESLASARKRMKGKKPRIMAASPSMQHVRAAEKNAKIAGVNKLIRFSRLDIEWLDAKLEDRSVDLVVSRPPQMRPGGFAAENARLARTYKDFFYHADFFMKKSGSIFFLTGSSLTMKELVAAASKHGFSHEVAREFVEGASHFSFVRFRKV